MKLVLDTKSFAEATAWVAKIIDPKDDKGYIALLVNADGVGALSHTSGLSYAKSPLVVNSVELAKGEEEVKLALSASFVRRFASTLRDHREPLVFSKKLEDPKSQLSATRPGENYTIPLVDSPIGAEPAYEVIGTVDAGEYLDTVNRLAKLTDPINAGTIPAVGSIDLQLDPEAGTATAMGTDRFSLGEISITFAPKKKADFYKNNRNLFLPEASARLITPSKGAVDNIELLFEEKSKKFGYAFPDGRLLLFALTSATPINYHPLKEKLDTNSDVLISVAELRNAISSISNLAIDEAEIILNIGAEGIDVIDLRETNSLQVNVQESHGLKEPKRVPFLRTILNQALDILATSRVLVKFKDSSSAFVFVPVYDDDSTAENVFLMTVPKV